MPKGYRTISVKEELYNRLMGLRIKHDIASFSDAIEYLLKIYEQYKEEREK